MNLPLGNDFFVWEIVETVVITKVKVDQTASWTIKHAAIDTTWISSMVDGWIPLHDIIFFTIPFSCSKLSTWKFWKLRFASSVFNMLKYDSLIWYNIPLWLGWGGVTIFYGRKVALGTVLSCHWLTLMFCWILDYDSGIAKKHKSPTTVLTPRAVMNN